MNRESEGKSSGIPHLAKNERDMGHPSLGEGINSPSSQPRSHYFPSCTPPSFFARSAGVPLMGANGKAARPALARASKYASPLRTGTSRLDSALFRTVFPR